MLNRRMMFAPLLLVLSACGSISVTIPPAGCSKLVPTNWAAGVDHAAVPEPVAADWGALQCASPVVTDKAACARAERALEGEKRYAAAYVAEAGQTSKANGRTADTIGIFGNCETLVNDARPRSLFGRR